MPRRSPILPLLALVLTSAALSGCTAAYKKSLGGETERNFARIYLTDFNTAWQSVLDSLKHARLDVSNREAGFIQTKWTDNTGIKNMIDSYGTTDEYLKAQFRFRVSVAQGSYQGRPGVKVNVFKEQVVSRDVLEGFRPTETDEIEEKTLLYRIGRIIFMRMKLAMLEERRTQQQMNDAGATDEELGAPGGGGGGGGNAEGIEGELDEELQ